MLRNGVYPVLGVSECSGMGWRNGSEQGGGINRNGVPESSGILIKSINAVMETPVSESDRLLKNASSAAAFHFNSLLKCIIPDYAIAKFAEDARRKVPQTTFSTSSALQRSRFGKIGNSEG